MNNDLMLPIRIMLCVVAPLIVYAEGDKAAEPQRQGALAPKGYHIYQSVQIDPQVSGFDGFLQLLQDKRVEGPIREALWGADEFMWCYKPSELKDFCASIEEKPLLPAILRLVRPDSSVEDSRTMERPLATMTMHHLYGSKKPTYFITVDYSTGMGAYPGPVTALAEVSSGRLQWLKALDARDGRQDEIALAESLKKAWKLAPNTLGTGQDILQIECWPAPSKPAEGDEVEFEVYYTRVHFDGDRWLKFERRKPGHFFNESDFPRREEFP